MTPCNYNWNTVRGVVPRTGARISARAGVMYALPYIFIYMYIHVCIQTLDSEAVLGVWLPAPLPTPRALPDHGAFWPLAVGVEKDLGGIDV